MTTRTVEMAHGLGLSTIFAAGVAAVVAIATWVASILSLPIGWYLCFLAALLLVCWTLDRRNRRAVLPVSERWSVDRGGGRGFASRWLARASFAFGVPAVIAIATWAVYSLPPIGWYLCFLAALLLIRWTLERPRDRGVVGGPAVGAVAAGRPLPDPRVIK